MLGLVVPTRKRATLTAAPVGWGTSYKTQKAASHLFTGEANLVSTRRPSRAPDEIRAGRGIWGPAWEWACWGGEKSKPCRHERERGTVDFFK